MANLPSIVADKVAEKKGATDEERRHFDLVAEEPPCITESLRNDKKPTC